ncbi:MotA/TolQ/ExbB proton channel family protein [Curvibacter sp. CHRR-16]|uniref:MotA/TolQ/ExbB proton channel family protein n=1 Tax=Curvibacter sp. CHRR-16 TaxID=2835872 RepID=UPI001BDB06AE|nr:MotA/TolQ/ExbB proton channel family protein [Curvibacter sp. CHRR-16]MBT0570461.1 MotA/TolQ/ExbB proton channel family protein [Curvibacter sp. CHRR-16]
MPTSLLHGDALSWVVALLLLLASISSWFLIVWKAWTLWQVERGLRRSTAAFWLAADWASAERAAQLWDGELVFTPLLQALQLGHVQQLGGQADATVQRTRQLRNALTAVQQRLRWGQTWLATVATTAPFVGLLGTVWGIYHALLGLSGGQVQGIGQVAGPVGEALIMTAFGLLVAIPAALGYNLLGRWVAQLESTLDGLAHDLLAWAPSANMAQTTQTPQTATDTAVDKA